MVIISNPKNITGNYVVFYDKLSNLLQIRSVWKLYDKLIAF